MSLIEQIYSNPGFKESEIKDITLYQLPFWTMFKAYFPQNSTSSYESFLANFSEEQTEFSADEANNFSDEQWLTAWTNYLQTAKIEALKESAGAASSIQQILATDYLTNAQGQLENSLTYLKQANNVASSALFGLNILDDLFTKKRENIEVTLNSNSVTQGFHSLITEDDFQKIYSSDQTYQTYSVPWITREKFNLLEYLKEVRLRIATISKQQGDYSESNPSGSNQLINILDQILSDLDIASFKTPIDDNLDYNLKAFQQIWQGATVEDPITENVETLSTSTNLRNAINSNTNYNDDVKVSLKKTMWVFEEFFKTAGKMINKLQTILSKVIGRINKN